MLAVSQQGDLILLFFPTPALLEEILRGTPRTLAKGYRPLHSRFWQN